ncbi:MAG TPA: argininosuccinate lyase [Candidatus Bilamarchaeum sp.]|nr:argininosuccinate lyase [Candidatus Bilamarchaeum sp.]
MKKMLWGGRFGKGPAGKTIEFNSRENVQLDEKLIPYDILGSIAHVKMLEKQGILGGGEAGEIVTALKAVYSRWERGEFRLKAELEDVHMNVEAAVTELTKNGKKMHTARSRNDQVLLDMRLYMRDEVLRAIGAIEALQAAFASLAKKDGPMASYTHTRVAQPITVSFWCQAWIDGLSRDKERLLDAYKRINSNPLGACAIAGTPWKIDRAETARMLAFGKVQENELDAISSRGECEAEVLSALSLLMCRLSRLSEELIWLSQKGLLSISEEHTTGSSIMPNKKNPDILELVRGRCARVYSNLTHCLVILKGLISGYHSDMQETKYAVMSGLEQSRESLEILPGLVMGLGFDRRRIEEELDSGFAQATEIADFLAMEGMPFREAHEKSGKLVKYCEERGTTLSKLPAGEAGKMLGIVIAKEKWAALVSLERERLRRSAALKGPGAAAEAERIEKAYRKLLS